MLDLYERIEKTVAAIGCESAQRPQVGLILGTGLGELPDGLTTDRRVGYSEIEGFPQSSAPGHAGELVFAHHDDGTRVVILRGRFHLYEGYRAVEVAFPIYVLAALGARDLLITNAAGALNPAYAPGDVMMIEDHLNFTGKNPLIGISDDRLGVRFPDMSDAYARNHQQTLQRVAKQMNTRLHSGIYAGVLGPSLETSAERRFLRRAGADAVGMSTIMEVIAANHCGMSVIGVSAISNLATGDADQQPDTIEQVLEHAAVASEKINGLIPPLLKELTKT